MKQLRFGSAVLFLASLGFWFVGCSGDGATEATYHDGDVGGAVGGSECMATVLIGLFDDDKCTNQVFSYKLDIGRPCSGWSRETGSGSRDNSGTRFQCFKDRLCYTQYVESYSCADSAARVEDKEVRTECTKDPTPDIWAKVLGGIENCPDVPMGFECPASGSTPGLAAACTLN